MASSSQAAVSSPTKKMKKHKKLSHRADKGKHRQTDEDFDIENAESSAAILTLDLGGYGSSSDFVIVQSVMRLPLAPVFAEDPLEGVRQALESWIMRYLTSIDAVLLTISWPPTLLEENAPLTPSSAFAMARVRWQGVAFRPQIASTSSGKLSLATPSVVSLLLHNLFNASIAAEHIPPEYEWDPDAILPYSLAPPPIAGSKAATAVESIQARDERQQHAQEEEEEAKHQGQDKNEEAAENAEKTMKDGEEEEEEQHDPKEYEEGVEEQIEAEEQEEEQYRTERGCWVNKATREPLGGSDGIISFTVIGLTIANSMISVHGSLLSDPTVVFARKEKEKNDRLAEKQAGQTRSTIAAGDDDSGTAAATNNTTASAKKRKRNQ